MKTLVVAAVVAVLALNVGVSWGISGKPVLDLDKCTNVVRYEDYSLVCKTDDYEYTMTTEDEGDTDQWVNVQQYQPVEPAGVRDLQPAAGGFQDTLENRHE